MAADRESGVTAIILSGGRGRRFDHRDKGLLEWRGKPLIEYVVDRIAPQVDAMVISSNRNQAEYRTLGYEIVSDSDPDFQGPIAGILAGVDRCKSRYVLVCPCDSPNLPTNLVTRLREGLAGGEADIAVAHAGIQRQNLVALMEGSVMASLRAYYEGGGRAVRNWYPGERVADVDFSAQAECFLNINQPEDLGN